MLASFVIIAASQIASLVITFGVLLLILGPGVQLLYPWSQFLFRGLVIVGCCQTLLYGQGPLSFNNLNEDLTPYLTSWEQQVASGVRGCSYFTGWASVAPTVVQRDYCLPLHCATHPG